MWPRGVTVSTLDSESSDRGSNPREALLAMFSRFMTFESLLHTATAGGCNVGEQQKRVARQRAGRRQLSPQGKIGTARRRRTFLIRLLLLLLWGLGSFRVWRSRNCKMYQAHVPKAAKLLYKAWLCAACNRMENEQSRGQTANPACKLRACLIYWHSTRTPNDHTRSRTWVVAATTRRPSH